MTLLPIRSGYVCLPRLRAGALAVVAGVASLGCLSDSAWGQANPWTTGSGTIYETGSNVGIGTTTPGSALAVNGVVNAGGNYYNVASYYLNGIPANGMKVKTNIPYANSSEMPTVIIEGYNYGAAETISVTIVWYVYGGNFIQYAASSSFNTPLLPRVAIPPRYSW